MVFKTEVEAQEFINQMLMDINGYTYDIQNKDIAYKLEQIINKCKIYPNLFF